MCVRLIINFNIMCTGINLFVINEKSWTNYKQLKLIVE